MPNDSTPKTRTAKSEPVTPGSGNVFADLGVPRPELAMAKADLAIRLCDAIRTRNLTRSQAGKLLKLAESRVAELMQGRLAGFSLDRLIAFLNRLELDVEIAVKPAQGPRKAGGTSVVIG